MDKIEKIVRENAIYSPSDYKEVDVVGILSQFELERKYAGQLSRVYKVIKEDWVIKEAKWDIKFEPFKPGIPIPTKLLDWLFQYVSFRFLPTREEILRQFKLYLEFAQYLGYFKNDKIYYHPNRDLISITQKQIRNSLLFFKPEIEKKYKFKIDNKIDEILSSDDIKYHNFLPKEYLLIGKSLSPENKEKVTSFIFQEFVKGELLYDVPDSKLEEKHKKQLVLMIYLILLMNMQIKIIPDTRPRYNFLQAYNWLTKTDNVIVTKEGLKFIDTRWFWNTKKFSLLIIPSLVPKLTIEKAKTSINNLLKSL